MRMLAAAAIVGVIALAGYVSAQDAPASPKPIYASDAMLRAPKRDTPALTCGLPDKSRHPVTTTAKFQGKVYRCVPMLNDELEWIGVAWTQEMPPAP